MPVEFKLGNDGIPYVVEFANVSVWPRRPDVTSPDWRAPEQVLKPPKRASTLAPLTIDKPLPALPAPERNNSLKRIFRRRQSEPVPTTPISEHWHSVVVPPARRRSSTVSRAERDAKTRDPLTTLSLFSMSQATLVESDDESDSTHGSDESAVLSPDTPHTPLAPTETLAPGSVYEEPLELQETDDLDIRSGGLHITFRDDPPSTPLNATSPVGGTLSPTSREAKRRLQSLSRAVANAVAAAGMISPPRRPQEQEQTQLKQPRRGHAGEKPSAVGGEALFRGTYGQVRTAFRSAGLAIKKCDERGFEGAVRVGTLFVANRDRHENVIFTKIVLYGSC